MDNFAKKKKGAYNKLIFLKIVCRLPKNKSKLSNICLEKQIMLEEHKSWE